MTVFILMLLGITSHGQPIVRVADPETYQTLESCRKSGDKKRASNSDDVSGVVFICTEVKVVPKP